MNGYLYTYITLVADYGLVTVSLIYNFGYQIFIWNKTTVVLFLLFNNIWR
jgi:hypothetical protein